MAGDAVEVDLFGTVFVPQGDCAPAVVVEFASGERELKLSIVSRWG